MLVRRLPSLEQFAQLDLETKTLLAQARDNILEQNKQIQAQTEAVATYDQVLANKASKHQLKELQGFCERQQSSLLKTTGSLQTQLEEAAAARCLMQAHSSEHKAALARAFEQIAEQERKLKCLVESVLQIKLSFERTDYQLRLAGVQDFARSLKRKAEQEQLDEVVLLNEQLQRNFQKTVVILHESLKLHQPRADDTREAKQNRIAQVLQLMHTIVNSPHFSCA